MTSKLCWITGAGGLIGSYLRKSAPRFASGWQVRGLARGDLDLTDTVAVRAAFNTQRPQLIIHCAAISKSPVCQQEPALARRVNVDVTRQLDDLATDIPFFFFSTDLVFDGRQGNYDETAAVNPLSVYAETKVAAEQAVLVNPRHTVIRTSLNGGVSPTGDRGFNEELRRAWLAGRTTKLFVDEYRSPIAATVTARAVWELVNGRKTGLYHLAGGTRLSRWEIGQLLAARWPDVPARMEASSLEEYSGAPRSPDTSFNSQKVQRELSFPLPGLGEWLKANPQEPF